jgi:glycosyltransferase
MKLTLITPTFNCSKTILRTIWSLNNQTYTNYEHIIVDGGSSDNTVDIITKNCNKTPKVICESDSGIYDALNKGIDAAEGDIIGFLHGDDELASPSVLCDIMDKFLNKKVTAVYGDLQYVSHNSPDTIIRHWKSKFFDRNLLRRGWMPPHPTLYVRKNWYNSCGKFDINFEISSDYDSVLRFFSNSSFNSVYLPKVIVKMKLGGKSNRSFTALFRKSREDFLVLRKNGFNLKNTLFALVYKNFSKIGQYFVRY